MMLLALVQRQAVLWAASRVVSGVVTAIAVAADSGTVRGGLVAPLVPRLAHVQLGAIVLACALGLVERRRNREDILLGNLGISDARFGATIVISSVAFESMFALALSAL
jgi:hypothetical protein